MKKQEDPAFKRLHQHAQKRLVFDPGVPRGQQLPAYKRYIELEDEMLKRLHAKSASGLKVCRARTAMVDVVLENLFLAALDLYATKHGTIPCKMALLATGGYGRRELNPHSDIDILFLYPEKTPDNKFTLFQEVLTEEILYPLWDFGWKVGHASRNTKEVIGEAQKEVQSKNAVLESRFICGSRSLYTRMYKRFIAYCQDEGANDYIQQRLSDERERHMKFGNTIYLQEPNIKNGIGGLRDYQNILWIAKIKFGLTSFRDINEVKLLRKHLCIEIEAAYDFLLRTRTELHLQNRRASDILNLEQQPSVALGLGYEQVNIFERVETFMQKYYAAARSIYQICEILKERLTLSSNENPRSTAKALSSKITSTRNRSDTQKIESFVLQAGWLFPAKRTVFNQDPLRLIRIFHIMQKYDARLHPDLKFRISRSLPLIDHTVITHPSAASSFNSILRAAGKVFPTLKSMHELGVLGRYLPEFGALTCKVQHEYYHRYTADEHVLRTIQQLDEIFQKKAGTSPYYERELSKNNDPLLLYLMLLLHDIGKSEGVKGHDISGTRIAKPVLKRFGISEKQQQQVLFIIQNHLTMTRIWRRFDLEDPKTAESFAKTVQDVENLRFLYVHTYCDARGTAPDLWNDYKETLHRILFERTLAQLSQKKPVEQKRGKKKQILFEQMSTQPAQGIAQEEVDAHFKNLPERYFDSVPLKDIQYHLRTANQFMAQNRMTKSIQTLTPIIEWYNDSKLNLTVVHVATWDRVGLFYKLAGALTLAGVNIKSTKAFSRKDHISIDSFYVMGSEGGVVTDKNVQMAFRAHCEECLVYGKHLASEIERMEDSSKSRKVLNKEFLNLPIATQVKAYYEASLSQTIIEITANDQIGLLYKIARQIYAIGFEITFARIATEREVAMDTFYIEPIKTYRHVDDNILAEIQETIKTIIDTKKKLETKIS